MNCLKSWKPFNDFIDVSSDGDVKSRGKMLKGEICRNGYKRIHVSKNGIHYKYLVHRLVAETFVPNPFNLPVVNHIDGNKQNNSVANLEWCTYSDNLKHAFKTGLRSCDGKNNNRHKLTNVDVQEIRRSYIKGKHGALNATGLAKKYGVNPKTILDIVNNKTWRTCV